MFDVVFMSYGEPECDKRFSELRQIAPWALRVKDINGIVQAHQEAAKTARTPLFYVVDADAEIINFDFRFIPEPNEFNGVSVWRSLNPLNGLVYGYGGIKLFPRKAVLEYTDDYTVDFTTTVADNFYARPEIASITRFNTGPFETWRSAFRECAKLSSKIMDNGVYNQQTQVRLDTWLMKADGAYSEQALAGAYAGSEFGKKFSDLSNDECNHLYKLNDFKWLKEQYDQYVIDSSRTS